MPFVGIALAVGLVAGIGASLSGASLVASLIIGAITAGLQLVSGLLQQQQDQPALPDFTTAQQDRTHHFRTTTAGRRFVIGESLVSGLFYPIGVSDSVTNLGAANFLPSGTNKFLHFLIVVASHQVEALGTVFYGDYPIYAADLSASGWVTTGKFANKLRIRKYLGTNDQTADTDLIADVPEWTSAHRGREVAYLYVTAVYDQNLFASGLQDFRVVCKGLHLTDIRRSGDPVLWSPNPALALRRFFKAAFDHGGLGCTDDEINDASIISEANICDEIVQTADVSLAVHSVDTSANTITFDVDVLPFQTGDRVRVESTGAVPSGLAGSPDDRFVIVIKERKRLANDEATVEHRPQIALANTYADALAGARCGLGSSGSGTISVIKDGEPRYTCNGLYETRGRGWRAKALSDMLSSMAGNAVNTGGQWRVIAGAWRPPTVTFDENDMRAAIGTPTKRPRRDRFTAVQGKYADPINLWNSDSYPPILSSTYDSEDGGRKFGLLDLPMTSRAQTARRIAKIALWKHRHQISASLKMKITGLQIQAGENFMVDNIVRGWVGQPLECLEFELKTEASERGRHPVFVVDVEGAETSADIFAWDYTTEEQAVAAKPKPRLPNPFFVDVPTMVAARTQTVFTEQGDQVFGARLSWAAPGNEFVAERGRMEISFRRLLGLSVRFDGVSDHILLDQDIEVTGSPQAFTLEATVFWDGNPTGSPGADHSIFNTGQFWLKRRQSDGKIAATLKFAGSPTVLVTAVSDDALPASTATHCAMTWDGSTLKLYIGGEEHDSVAAVGTLTADIVRPRIGMGEGLSESANPWSGDIDEVRFWDVARTQEEIDANKAVAVDPQQDDLRHYWTFDGLGAGFAQDETVNNNFGNVEGAEFVDGYVTPNWEPSFFVDGRQLFTVVSPLDGQTNYDFRFRFVNVLGVTSEWVALSGFTVRSPSSGADTTEDWGMFVGDPVTESLDWGMFSGSPDASPDEFEDWGTFT